MFSNTFDPRFLETDALGHINNTVLPMWFEASRDPVFKFFTPNMDVKDWKLILASFNVNFHGETHYGTSVEIRTYISRIGNSAFDVYQECWQQGTKSVSGTATMVHFCHDTKKSVPLTESQSTLLRAHLLTD